MAEEVAKQNEGAVRLERVDDVNLEHHAVIEASAGSGKTYTLEGLVMRLIREKKMAIEEILLVTFTEKATGEMKERIRERLYKEREALDPQQDAKLYAHISRQAENFDQAMIFTIHGFCNHVLEESAFENAGHFDPEVSDAADSIVSREIAAFFRETLPQTYGRHLPLLLKAGGGVRKIREFLGKLLGEWNPEAGETFAPDSDYRGEELAVLLKKWDTIQKLFSEQNKKQLASELEENRNRISNYKNKISLLAPLLNACESDANAFLIADSLIKNTQKILASTASTLDLNKPFTSYLIPLKGKDKGKEEYFLPVWSRFLSNMNNLFPGREKLEYFKKIKGVFLAWAARDIYGKVQAQKEARGQITYDDMLAQVARALRGDKGNPLLEKLRKQFSAALIDEFQDTDILQWRIFRKIFVEAEHSETGHFLCVVGDPKQSIYSFRGADVMSYQEACRELVSDYGASRYYLPRNWRSRPRLVAAWNTLFTGMASELTLGEDITVQAMDTPPPEHLRCRAAADRSGRAPLTLLRVKTEAEEKVASAELKRRVYGWIGEEIGRLLGRKKGPGKDTEGMHALLEIRSRNSNENGAPEFRALNAGDIAVLAGSHSEVARVERFLREADVPCSVYKKQGLFQSDEAFELLYVLAAIAEPDDPRLLNRGLLTRFFYDQQAGREDYRRRYLASLAAGFQPDTEQPFREIFYSWHRLARERRWAELFTNLLETSGLVYRENLLPGRERRLTNWAHLCDNLQQYAAEEGVGISDLVRSLENWTQGIDTGDEDLHRLESELPRVQIMTIHASKGLEFPVVFIAALQANKMNNQTKYYKFHDREQRHFVYDLLKSETGKRRAEEEAAAEKKRDLYVAMTRAAYKLYMPWYSRDDTGKSANAISDLYSAVARNNPAMNFPEEEIGLLECGAAESRHFPPDQDEAAGTTSSAVSLVAEKALSLEKFHLLRRTDFAHLGAPKRRITIDSYSRLVRRFEADDVPLPGALAADEWVTALDSEAFQSGRPSLPELDGSLLLPRGPKPGSMLHEILEDCEYQEVLDTEEKDLQSGDIAGNAFLELVAKKLEAWGIRPVAAYFRRKALATGQALPSREEQQDTLIRETALLIRRTLATPLPGLEDNVCLGQLTREERRHEVAFHFAGSPGMGETAHAGSILGGHYLSGFIDLLFRYNGKYYLADWKSNWLPAYSQQELRGEMQRHRYDFQYTLYSRALWQWLERLGEDFSAFGGVYYLFVRGMNGRDTEQGVFWETFASPAIIESNLGSFLEAAAGEEMPV